MYGGSGLTCGVCCCCYGCERPDVIDVWVGGCVLAASMSYGYGYCASCLIGLKMLGMMKWRSQ